MEASPCTGTRVNIGFLSPEKPQEIFVLVALTVIFSFFSAFLRHVLYSMCILSTCTSHTSHVRRAWVLVCACRRGLSEVTRRRQWATSTSTSTTNGGRARMQHSFLAKNTLSGLKYETPKVCIARLLLQCKQSQHTTITWTVHGGEKENKQNQRIEIYCFPRNWTYCLDA